MDEGHLLRHLRDQYKLTQKDASELVDLAPTYIANLERGRNPLTAKALDKFLNAYKISHEDFNRLLKVFPNAANAEEIIKNTPALPVNSITDYDKRQTEILKLNSYKEMFDALLAMYQISLEDVSEATWTAPNVLKGLREGTISPSNVTMQQLEKYFNLPSGHIKTLFGSIAPLVVKRLNDFASLLHFSKRKLYEEIDFAPSNITNWKNRMQDPSKETISKITQYLHISSDDFLNPDITSEELYQMWLKGELTTHNDDEETTSESSSTPEQTEKIKEDKNTESSKESEGISIQTKMQNALSIAPESTSSFDLDKEVYKKMKEAQTMRQVQELLELYSLQEKMIFVETVKRQAGIE